MFAKASDLALCSDHTLGLDLLVYYDENHMSYVFRKYEVTLAACIKMW